MTELELCQLSQRALLLKNAKLAKLAKRRLRRLQKAEAAVRKLLLRCEEYEKAIEDLQEQVEYAEMGLDDA